MALVDVKYVLHQLTNDGQRDKLDEDAWTTAMAHAVMAQVHAQSLVNNLLNTPHGDDNAR